MWKVYSNYCIAASHDDVGGMQYDWDSATVIGLFVVRLTVTFLVLFSFCHFGSFGIGNYDLPEWVQDVQGGTPRSGTRGLPLNSLKWREHCLLIF